MSEWYYSEKSDTIRNVKDTKSNSERALRELRSLKDDFSRIMRQQRQILDNQEKMMAGMAELSRTVAKMHAEIYPEVDETKPPMKPHPHATKPGR